MTVYVDNFLVPWRGMKMSHLMADDLDELHEFAARLGLRRSWFQGPPEHSIPHYDVSAGKRREAIAMGAVEEDFLSDNMAAFRREQRRRARARQAGIDVAGTVRPRIVYRGRRLR